MFTGTLTAREPVQFGRGGDGKITAISVFRDGGAEPGLAVRAGQIARLWGLTGIQVGDRIGSSRAEAARYFAPPTLETVVVPERPSQRAALYSALAQLAEEDPLINLRQDNGHREVLVSLYGDVQKEVIQATLADDFGIAASFRETTTICAERLTGTGEAAESMDDPANPFKATVGLRVGPGPAGSGVQFRVEIELGSLPASFLRAVEETATGTLQQGLYGWQVLDCVITLTRSGYVPPPPSGWSVFSSSAGDFRNLTPLVLMAALRQAGTVVCEPVSSFWLEIPAICVPAVMTALARLRAVGQTPALTGSSCVIEGEIPSGHVHELQQQLPSLTAGEGILESAFARYQPVSGPPPSRPNRDCNPLNRREYLLRVQRRLNAR